MGEENPIGRPLPLGALAEIDRTRWATILSAAERLSCDETPVDFGKADPSAAFVSIDDLRDQCDEEYLKPLRSTIRAIRAEATHVYGLDNGDVSRFLELVERALEGVNAPLQPVWGADGSVTMRRWRGADGIQALIKALKERCL